MTCGFFSAVLWPSRTLLPPSLLYPSFYGGDTRWVSTRNDPLNAGTFHSVEAIAAAALFMAAMEAFIISLLVHTSSRLLSS